jgi:dienelactone hydrolase
MKYKKHFFLLFSVIYFIVVLILLFSVRSLSYNHYERINFESSRASIYANLFYPEGKLTFQEKHPFIIFAHGLGSQKDLDPRIPIEFTKRGFVVASIDYRGDGESTGHLLDINRDSYRNRTDVPAVAQDCSKLLDVIERHPVYDMINSSQIGLVGHSLGGMVALMTGALDERFKATVTWAGLVNASANFFGIGESNPFMNYIPARIINESNPQNLLVIHSIYDTTVPYETNALVAQNLTNCQLISITNHILGGQHYLFSDEVLTGTINWFEAQFFNSTTLNGPISLTYFQTYILLFLAILGTFLTTIAIIIWITDFFIIVKDKSCTLSDQREKIGKKINKRHVLKQSIKISLYFSGFLLIWITYFTLMGILGLIFAPIFIILIFFVWIVLKYIGTTEDKKQNIKLYIVSKLKEEIKSQCRKHVLLYSLVSTAIFLGLYFSLSISYPFAFFFPFKCIKFHSYIYHLSFLPCY